MTLNFRKGSDDADDTGSQLPEAIKTIENGEALNEVYLSRAEQNLRNRTEQLRQEVDWMKLSANSDRGGFALSVQDNGVLKQTHDGSGTFFYCCTAGSDNWGKALHIVPLLSRGGLTSLKPALRYYDGANGFSLISKLEVCDGGHNIQFRIYNYGSVIPDPIVTIEGALNTTDPTAEAKLGPVCIAVGLSSGHTHTAANVITAINGTAGSTALVTAAAGTGTGALDPDRVGWDTPRWLNGYSTDNSIAWGDTGSYAGVDGEGYMISGPTLESIFSTSAWRLTEGQTLAINFLPDWTLNNSGPSRRMAQRVATTVPAGSICILGDSTKNWGAAIAAGAVVPICKLYNGKLHFVGGTVLTDGVEVTVGSVSEDTIPTATKTSTNFTLSGATLAAQLQEIANLGLDGDLATTPGDTLIGADAKASEPGGTAPLERGTVQSQLQEVINYIDVISGGVGFATESTVTTPTEKTQDDLSVVGDHLVDQLLDLVQKIGKKATTSGAKVVGAEANTPGGSPTYTLAQGTVYTQLGSLLTGLNAEAANIDTLQGYFAYVTTSGGIQTAINAAAAGTGPGIILVKPGAYDVTLTLPQPYDHIYVLGLGDSAAGRPIFRVLTSGVVMTKTDTSGHYTFENITFRTGSSTEPIVSVSASSSAYKLHFTKCKFEYTDSSNASPMIVAAGYTLTFNDCVFQGNASAATTGTLIGMGASGKTDDVRIHVERCYLNGWACIAKISHDDGPKYFMFTNNRFGSCGYSSTSATSVLFDFTGASGNAVRVEIDSNNWTTGVSSTYTGAFIRGKVTGYCNNNYIGRVSGFTSETGYAILNTNDTSDWLVSNNMINCGKLGGISSPGKIFGNTLLSFNPNSITDYGIKASGSFGTQIMSNTVNVNGTGNIIGIHAGVISTRVIGNTVTSTSSGSCVYVGDNGCVVSGNALSQAVYGVAVYGDGAKVFGNDINNQIGVYVNAERALVSGNDIAVSGIGDRNTVGVHVTADGDHACITGNHIYAYSGYASNSLYGVYSLGFHSAILNNYVLVEDDSNDCVGIHLTYGAGSGTAAFASILSNHVHVGSTHSGIGIETPNNSVAIGSNFAFASTTNIDAAGSLVGLGATGTPDLDHNWW